MTIFYHPYNLLRFFNLLVKFHYGKSVSLVEMERGRGESKIFGSFLVERYEVFAMCPTEE